jgi:hypothetical protein
MGKRIDVGNGRVWARCPGLPRGLGRRVEMPASYDPAAVTEDDLAHDGALRPLTADEVERAETCTSCKDRLAGPCCDLCGDCRAAEDALGRACCS